MEITFRINMGFKQSGSFSEFMTLAPSSAEPSLAKAEDLEQTTPYIISVPDPRTIGDKKIIFGPPLMLFS